MEEKNLTSAPEATTNARATGVMDKDDSNIKSDDGYVMMLNFFDALGYRYTAKFAVKVTNPDEQLYTVELSDILDSNNHSVLEDYITEFINSGQGTRNDALTTIFGQNAQLEKSYTSSDPNLIYNNGQWQYRYTSYEGGANNVPVQSTLLSNNMVQSPDNPFVYEVTYTVYSEEDRKKIMAGDTTVTGTPFCDNRDCAFALWKDNKFFSSKKKSITKSVAAALLKEGRVSVSGLYSEKTGKTYDAVVLLDDTGGKYVNFRLEFPAKKGRGK